MGVEVPSNPINRKEQYLAKIAGQAVEVPTEPLTREEAYLDEIAKNSGGGGGTTDYNLLENKPQIAGTELQGNKSLADLGIASANDLAGKQDALTAGIYIQMDNGVISVKRDITQTAQTLYYHITIKSNDNYINVEKTQNGVKVSDTEYNWQAVTSNPANVDDCFTISTSGTNWVFTNLIASTTQPAGYAKTLYKSDPRYDYSTTYVTTVDADKKLIIQSELDDAMATKQDALTAGDYVSINNGTIGVTLTKGLPNVYGYKFITTSTSDHTPSVKIQKYLNGTLVSEQNYINNDIRTPITVDDRFTFVYGDGGWGWKYTLLVASNDHIVGYSKYWEYREVVEYEEDYDVYDEGTTLATKGDVDTALADKANTDMVAADFNAGTSYTAGNYCVQDGKLYKFKNNHSGAWSSADVDEVKITGELSSLKSGLNDVTDIDLSAFTPATGVALDANADCYIKRRNGFVFGWLKFDGLLTIPSSGAFQIGNINSVYRTSLKTVRVPIYLNTPSGSPNFAVAILVLFGTGTVFVIGTPGTYGKETGSGVNSWDTGDGVYFSYPVGV